MHLYESLVLYSRVKNSLEPEGARDFQRELAAYQDSIAPGKLALEQSEKGKDANQEDMRRIAGFFKQYSTLANFAYPMIIPPLPGESRTNWSNIGLSLKDVLRTGQLHPADTSYAAMADSYHNDKPAEFNRAVAQYRVWMEENGLYPALKKGGQEFFFNQIEPFYKSMVIYVAALLLGCLFWINLSEPVRRDGLCPAGAGLCHSFPRVWASACIWKAVRR